MLRKIVSGGQTGVDRGALDAARAAGMAQGGWCPKGRRAEDGPIPETYPLRETQSEAYDVRTRLNVRDAEGTLILHRGEVAGGTALTLEAARALQRPVLVQNLSDPGGAVRARAWLEDHRISVLNVAGPREGEAPGISRETFAFLTSLLQEDL